MIDNELYEFVNYIFPYDKPDPTFPATRIHIGNDKLIINTL